MCGSLVAKCVLRHLRHPGSGFDCGFEHPSGVQHERTPQARRAARTYAVFSRGRSIYIFLPGNQPRLLARDESKSPTRAQAVLGMDIICQAKSGTGKTAVFACALRENTSSLPLVLRAR